MDTKVDDHGTTEVHESGKSGDPPPYPGPPPNMYEPQPGYTAGVYPQPTPQELPMQDTVIPTMVPAEVVIIPDGPNPVLSFCESCNQQIFTRVKRKPKRKAYFYAALLCILGEIYGKMKKEDFNRLSEYGPNPVKMTCPKCGKSITTKMSVFATRRTHTAALIVCLLGGLCCIWIPWCINSCGNNIHYCPKCKAKLGKHVRVD